MSIPELPLLTLDDDERTVFDKLRGDLVARRYDLELVNAYYDGMKTITDLGISIPPQLRGLHTVIGWPRVGVDAVDGRLDVDTIRYADGSDSSELVELWDANRLWHESQLVHLDALVYGHSYMAVGSGDVDGPALITVESPMDMTTSYDARARTVTAGLREYVEEGGERAAVLYLPYTTISLVEGDTGWEIIGRDDHDVGVVPIVRFSNRQRISQRTGASEITPEIRSITDAACRTLLGMEVSREFFAAPQRYILGASEGAFEDQEGNPLGAWETYIGRVLGLERDEDGNLPEVGQFPVGDPSAFTRIIDLYARIMASLMAVPPQMLGYTTDNPASADAIRSAQDGLVVKAERKQRLFSTPHADALRLGLLWRHGELPEAARSIDIMWRNPATPTLAAQTDAAVKLVTARILPEESDVALEMVGLREEQRARVRAERRRAQGRQVLAEIGARAAQRRTAVEEVDGESGVPGL
jgi:hypothetical protein